jgi:glycosyltransferase involved in cell wall biosynthesis
MTQRRPVVLATSDYYSPGDKGGGAVHALSNMVDRLGGEWVFKIITRDRDIGDATPYPEVMVDLWHEKSNAKVMYLSAVGRLSKLWSLVRKTEFDILYLNSFFSPAFSIPLLLARRFRLIPVRPFIVAPRGEFSKGALRIGYFKKNAYIILVKMLRIGRDAVWHVSSESEEADVRRCFGDKARVVVARDCLPLSTGEEEEYPPREKTAGQLDIVFLSRICRMKNLDGALSRLFGLQGTVHMRIYGPREEDAYWQKCQRIIKRLPSNIQIEYCGGVSHKEVLQVMARHHLFFLPTHGENFGFAIFEAILAGCLILISDQTPWRGLEEKGIGWDLSLGELARFQEVLQICIDMDQAAYSRLSKKARAYGLQLLRDDQSVEQNSRLFKTALGDAGCL